MARRQIKPQHRALIDKAGTALTEETVAKERIKREIQQRVRESVNDTNRLLSEAVDGGVTRQALADALGVSLSTVYNRIAAHRDRVGYSAPVQGEPEEHQTVWAERPDDGYIVVTLDDFTHPDVGTGVSGVFQFNDDGDLMESNRADLTEANPFFGDKLWATTEVQRAVNA